MSATKAKVKQEEPVVEEVAEVTDVVDGDVDPNEEADRKLKEEMKIEFYEPLVYKLAYLEQSLLNVRLDTEVKRRVYDERIQGLKIERATMLSAMKNKERDSTMKLEAIRTELSEKHSIDLKEYAYDDETGFLRKVPANNPVTTPIN